MADTYWQELFEEQMPKQKPIPTEKKRELVELRSKNPLDPVQAAQLEELFQSQKNKGVEFNKTRHPGEKVDLSILFPDAATLSKGKQLINNFLKPSTTPTPFRTKPTLKPY